MYRILMKLRTSLAGEGRELGFVYVRGQRVEQALVFGIYDGFDDDEVESRRRGGMELRIRDLLILALMRRSRGRVLRLGVFVFCEVMLACTFPT